MLIVDSNKTGITGVSIKKHESITDTEDTLMRSFGKLVIIVAALLMLFSQILPAAVQAAAPIRIILDGRTLTSDVPPYIIPGVYVTMVPTRLISEGIGASVVWSGKDKTVTIRKAGREIVLTSGQTTAMVDGAKVTLAAPATVRNGRVMVPLRFIAEQLGLQVVWIQRSSTIQLTSAASPSEEEELRGAWISTIYRLDWPSEASLNDPEAQRREFSNLLDDLQQAGINAVFVQIRAEADAFYPSELVPWTRYLTGTQGQDPGYDPLAFMIEEAHLRGMEFHAWFNPFRAHANASDTKGLAKNHVVNAHPEWIVQSGNILYINPGIPEARRHIIEAIVEAAQRYDIDGVHLDDYFYPSNGDFADQRTFAEYNPRQIKDIRDWRRDNINEFVRELGEKIHAAKPSVEFGISPFGVWRNKDRDPSGSNTRASVTAYDDMYADVRTWIRRGWIDYVAPQIYWSLSFDAARFDVLVDWWADEVKDTNVRLYIGHAAYKLGTGETGWQSVQEIVNQVKYSRLRPESKGNIYFRARHIQANTLGLSEALRALY
jgi:uncharacterized lipoprotein YddW (UPF0748 family)